MIKNFGELDASIQQQVESDTEFQSSLESLSDDEKKEAVQNKKSEILDKELANLSEKADKASKNEENYLAQKKRAERAEEDLKKNKPNEKESDKNEDNISQKDLLILAKADIHDDDLEDVIEFAKFKKVTIAEALKNSTLKTILTDKEEFRKTADAANSGTTKRVANKVSVDTIVKEANEGKFPEKGSKEAEELFWARRGGKRN